MLRSLQAACRSCRRSCWCKISHCGSDCYSLYPSFGSNTSTLDVFFFFQTVWGSTYSTFTMLMKPLYACCVPFRQPAVAVHLHSLDAPWTFHTVFRQPAVAVHLHSLDAPWTFHTVFCCRERLSKSFLKAFHQVASHLVVVDRIFSRTEGGGEG